MDIAGRVRLKSDRRARALIMALCVAPVAMPLLAAGLNSIFLASAGSSSAHATDPQKQISLPTLRPAMDNPLFAPAPLGPVARIEQRPAIVATTAFTSVAVSTPSASSPAVQALRRPRLGGAHTFRAVTILEGLQIGAEGMVFALAGVEPAPQGSECKRLDGVVEPCAQRAANRLEILTRGRPVVCDMQDSDAGMVRGACRAGKIDLADDLVRNGLAVRTSDRS